MTTVTSNNRFLVGICLGVVTTIFIFFSLDYVGNYDRVSTLIMRLLQPWQESIRDVTATPKENKSMLSAADNLSNNVRVCTWVMTYPKNHNTKARAVRDTWGKRMNKLLFMSSETDSKLPSIDLHLEESRDFLWGKTKASFKYFYDFHLDDCDWFMKADDDTFVVAENLRYLLNTYSTEDPIYFGSRFKPFTKQGYMSGGGGYVLSKMALKMFVEKALNNETLCRKDSGGAEDAEMGKCLFNIGVIAGDSRDHLGRGRFFPFEPSYHVLENFGKPDWYYQYRYYPIENGTSGCSDTAITFHYVNENQMYLMDYFLYHLRPFGKRFESEFPMPLPPDWSVVPQHVLEEYGQAVPSESKETQSKTKVIANGKIT